MIGRLRGWMVRLRWARFYLRGGDRTWMHEPRVRRYVNASVSGAEDRWPTDWLKDRFATEPFRRGLSLGCGSGALERDLIAKGICREVLGVDLLESALDRARHLARKAGLSGIEYRRVDLNRRAEVRRLSPAPGAFDVVFFHQSLHHVEDLEGCLAEVRRALAPGDKIYLDEYVGPARDEWRPGMLADAQAAFDRLPAAVRRRPRVGFPIDRSDPSEAVRSSAILPVLEQHFRIVERRDYGGNLLAVIHPYLRHDRLDEPVGESALEELISAEKALLATGVPSYYTVLVGEPR